MVQISTGEKLEDLKASKTTEREARCEGLQQKSQRHYSRQDWSRQDDSYDCGHPLTHGKEKG